MPGGQEIKVNFPPNLQGGVYSNNMVVTHTKEEFILDFLMVAPPAGAVTARVIVSPGHMERSLTALQDNISKYEHLWYYPNSGRTQRQDIVINFGDTFDVGRMFQDDIVTLKKILWLRKHKTDTGTLFSEEFGERANAKKIDHVWTWE